MAEVRPQPIRTVEQILEAPVDRHFVYFIQPAHGGPIKVGTSWDPEARCEQLQTAWPYSLRVCRVLPGGRELERALHDRFAVQRLMGEWFDPTPELAAIAWAKESVTGAPVISDPRRRPRIVSRPGKSAAERAGEKRMAEIGVAQLLYHRDRAARGLRSSPKPLRGYGRI